MSDTPKFMVGKYTQEDLKNSLNFDPTSFKHFPEIANDPELQSRIIASFTPEQKALLHNMRSDACAVMHALDPFSPTFTAAWYANRAQILFANTLLGA